MRAIGLVAATVFAAVIMGGYFPGYAGDGAAVSGAGNDAAVLAQFGTTYMRRTCSGELATPLADNYMFGLKDDEGACSTMRALANDYDEALQCVRAFCPTCYIEDITGNYTFSTAVGILEYCPKR